MQKRVPPGPPIRFVTTEQLRRSSGDGRCGEQAGACSVRVDGGSCRYFYREIILPISPEGTLDGHGGTRTVTEIDAYVGWSIALGHELQHYERGVGEFGARLPRKGRFQKPEQILREVLQARNSGQADYVATLLEAAEHKKLLSKEGPLDPWILNLLPGKPGYEALRTEVQTALFGEWDHREKQYKKTGMNSEELNRRKIDYFIEANNRLAEINKRSFLDNDSALKGVREYFFRVHSRKLLLERFGTPEEVKKYCGLIPNELQRAIATRTKADVSRFVQRYIAAGQAR